jgi:beta-fructofuranosidase
MPLKLADKWIWDFWFAQDGPDYHLFYLQASRDLPEEKLRHWHVSIGHAVSQDLRNWQVLPNALRPAPAAEDVWDNYSTWTGSVFGHDGSWYLFYTGVNRREKGLIQRIGLATSTDLITWIKHPANPVLIADPQWYETLDPEMWHDQAWRDPWIFELDGRFHALITARSNKGHKSARGVIGHAWSDDLVNWQVGPPIAAPGEFGHMEVPQLVEINGRYYLIFCVGRGAYADARRDRPGIGLVTGTHYMAADQPLGPYKFLTDQFLLADEAGSRYAGKLIRDPSNNWVLMTGRFWTGDGGFIGELADPLPLQIDAGGRLQAMLPPDFEP